MPMGLAKQTCSTSKLTEDRNLQLQTVSEISIGWLATRAVTIRTQLENHRARNEPNRTRRYPTITTGENIVKNHHETPILSNKQQECQLPTLLNATLAEKTSKMSGYRTNYAAALRQTNAKAWETRTAGT